MVRTLFSNFLKISEIKDIFSLDDGPFDGILLRYSGEITIKSEGVRRFWEDKLYGYVKNVVGSNGIIRRERGRLYIIIKQKNSFSYLIKKLVKIFGFSSLSPVIICESRLDEIKACAKKLVKFYLDKFENRKNLSFAIIAKKSLARSFGTTELRNDIGAFIKDTYNLKVDLSNPDIPVYIEARENITFVYSHIIPCPGGLPYGVQDKVISLTSGGPDSTLATWFILRRGSPVICVYYDFGQKELRSEARNRVLKIFKHLCDNWIPVKKSKLYIIPFDKVIKEIFLNVSDKKFAYVLLKRMMVYFANIIAEREHARGIVTGEIVGEHASQTIWNLDVITFGSKVQILRPLLGFDKSDVLKLLKNIDEHLYELASKSIEPCKIITDIKPTTRANLHLILEDEKKVLKVIEDKLDEILESSSIIEF